MSKKKNSVNCAIHKIGLQLLAHPEGVDKRSTTRGVVRGANTHFQHFETRMSGMIRIPVPKQHHLADKFEKVYEYHTTGTRGVEKTTIANVIPIDFMCMNIGLSAGVPRRPKGFSLDLDKGDYFDELLKQIKNCFQKDPACSNLLDSMKQGVYYSGFAVVFVDDLSRLYKKMEAESRQCILYDSGVLEYQTSLTIDGIRFPLYRVGVAPFDLLVMENKDVSDWVDSGVISQKHLISLTIARLHVDNILHSKQLSVLERQRIMLRARSIELLESLPEGKPQSHSEREERMEKLTSISENLAFYRSTHLLAKDFLLYGKTPEPIPGSTELEQKKETLEGEMEILSEQLQLLEQALQTRLMVENIAIGRHREEQQERTESGFRILTLTVSAFFMFEIVATLFAWFLSPNYLVSWLPWIILLTSPFPLLYFLYREYLKMTSSTSFGSRNSRISEEPSKWVHHCCPHCGKGYHYKDSATEIVCQHCAKLITSRIVYKRDP